MIKMLAIILAIILGLGSVYLFGDDNPIEEVTEKIIEEETGIDIDLSPQTPEKTQIKNNLTLSIINTLFFKDF